MKKCVKMLTAAVCAAVMMNAAAVTAGAEWKDTDTGKAYYDENGEKETGFREIDGKIYYFDKGGTMLTGLKRLTNVDETGVTYSYYFRADGSLYTGWAKTKSGHMMYFDPAEGKSPKEKHAVVSFQEIGGKLYYFGLNGCLDESVGWNGYRYYNKDHSITRNTELTLDGKTYTFDKSGIGILSELAERKPSELKIPDLRVPADEELMRCGAGKMYVGNVLDGDFLGSQHMGGKVLVNGKECEIFVSMTDERKLNSFSFTCPHECSGYLIGMLTEKFGAPYNTVPGSNCTIYYFRQPAADDTQSYMFVSVEDFHSEGVTQVGFMIKEQNGGYPATQPGYYG